MTDGLLNRGHVDLDNDAIVYKCYDFVKNYNLDYNTDSIYGKFMSIYLSDTNVKHLMPHKWVEFAPLVDAIKKQSNLDTIDRSWFNIVPNGKEIRAHSHVDSGKAGATYGSFVYYPNVEKEDSQIELLLKSKWVPIPVTTGDWICFKLSSIHRVPKNKTDHPRISVVFNV